VKEIRFAIVGFGNIAKTHMTALRAMPIVKKLPFVPVLDTLITRNPEANREQAAAIGFLHVDSSLEKVLDERQIDVVDICTPNALHMEPFLTAVKASKAVYCEKPLTERYDHSAALIQEAGADSRHQTALVYRYHPAVLRIKEMLRQGMIGDVLQCRCSYRRSGYLNAARPVSWRLNETLTGGGAISDLGVHVLDLLSHLFGEIEHVDGKTNTFVKKRPAAETNGALVDITVDDWASMLVLHRSGVLASAEVSRIAWGSEAFQLDIVGTAGSITCDLEKEYMPKMKLLDGSSPAVPNPAALSLLTDDKSTMGMAVDCHFGALNHFLHRLTGDDRFPADLAPSIQDCLQAEYWIDQVLRQNGAMTR
jgi:predicted dehydrogenase